MDAVLTGVVVGVGVFVVALVIIALLAVRAMEKDEL